MANHVYIKKNNCWFCKCFQNWSQVLTYFTEALVLVNPAVELDGGVRRVLQQEVGRMLGISVFLYGLQQQGVAGNSLYWHHQEEAESGGIHIWSERDNKKRRMLMCCINNIRWWTEHFIPGICKYNAFMYSNYFIGARIQNLSWEYWKGHRNTPSMECQRITGHHAHAPRGNTNLPTSMFFWEVGRKKRTPKLTWTWGQHAKI